MNSVKLVAHTVPVDSEIKNLVAYCARVSNPSNQFNHETEEKLLKYLMKHKHWSPFEMYNVILEVNTTRDIARQLLRHRFNFQEFSQRYAEVEDGVVLREARLQDETNRQNSIETDDDDLQQAWAMRQDEVIDAARDAYEWAIDQGIAKEIARVVLPEGLTKTRLYVNGTLRNWIHYLQVRLDPSTQKEHRKLAQLCKNEISTVFPMINNIV